MPREIVFSGMLVPALVPLFFLCLILLWQLDRLFRSKNVYRLVAHPALFRLAVFVILFCMAGLYVYR